MSLWRKGNPHTLFLGIETDAATVENSREGTKIFKNETALKLSDSNLGYIPDEIQNTNLKEYMHPYAHFSIIYNSQVMEVTRVPINRQVDKKMVVH